MGLGHINRWCTLSLAVKRNGKCFNIETDSVNNFQFWCIIALWLTEESRNLSGLWPENMKSGIKLIQKKKNRFHALWTFRKVQAPNDKCHDHSKIYSQLFDLWLQECMSISVFTTCTNILALFIYDFDRSFGLVCSLEAFFILIWILLSTITLFSYWK